jgi:hypothetical protein
MNYDKLMENFDELNEQIRQATQQMREKSEGLVEGMVKIFLDECPEVTGVHWTQYTPYFNDGEACEFNVNEICFHILEDEDDEIEAWESTTLYGTGHLAKAKKSLKVAEEYAADPEAWRKNYLDQYYKDYGRNYPYNSMRLKPYPSDPADAQRDIEKIERSLEKYPAEVADRIEKSFAKVVSALHKVPEDIMQSVYGDHVMVVINRDGTTIDEYDHD